MTDETQANGIYKICTAHGTGSAFGIEGEPYVATNFHVVAGSRTVAIELADKRRIQGEVVLVDPAWDLALIKPAEALSEGLNLREELPKVGDGVLVYGFPYGMPFSITKGVVSAEKQPMADLHYIQTDAAVNPGNSGGPLVDEEGKVLGVTTCKLSDADNMGFALPVAHVQTDLELLKSEGEDRYALKCPSCETLLFEAVEYCDGCGTELDPTTYFPEENLSLLGVTVESAFKRLGHNPILTRAGHHRWIFFQGSARIYCHLFSQEHLTVSSPMARLAKKPAEVLRYLLAYDHPQYSFRVDGDGTIRLSLELHLSDIFNEDRQEAMQTSIAGLATAADEVDNLLIEKFGCQASSTTLESAL